jgi:hypothetical protein
MTISVEKRGLTLTTRVGGADDTKRTDSGLALLTLLKVRTIAVGVRLDRTKSIWSWPRSIRPSVWSREQCINILRPWRVKPPTGYGDRTKTQDRRRYGTLDPKARPCVSCVVSRDVFDSFIVLRPLCKTVHGTSSMPSSLDLLPWLQSVYMHGTRYRGSTDYLWCFLANV